MNDARISAITLDEQALIRRSPEVEREWAVATADLLEENRFEVSELSGPYRLHLSLAENRLSLAVMGAERRIMLTLPLVSLRGIVKDYFLICESYFDAVRQASPSRIETIDMARRGIHNEGAETLTGLLAAKVTLDHATARRLFTLVFLILAGLKKSP